MTTPTAPDWYQQMLDEIIQQIKDDDTANSETVAALVTRLRELQALGQAEFLSRRINTGNGLTGGGDLSADRTLSLSEGVLESMGRADSAVQPAALSERLQAYLTSAETAATYATKSAVGISWVPFSHPGTINGETTSPPLSLPGPARLVGVAVAAESVDAALSVSVTGGASASVSLASGATSGQASNLSAEITGPVRVRLASAAASGVTVTLRVQAVVA